MLAKAAAHRRPVRALGHRPLYPGGPSRGVSRVTGPGKRCRRHNGRGPKKASWTARGNGILRGSRGSGARGDRSRMATLRVNGRKRDVDVTRGHPAALGAARRAPAHRHQVRLRHRPVRRLHRPRRRQGRCAPACTPVDRRWATRDHDHRRAVGGKVARPCRGAWTAARRGPVRLLPDRARSCRRSRCWPRSPSPPTTTSTRAMTGNICRCATYVRIRAADPRGRQDLGRPDASWIAASRPQAGRRGAPDVPEGERRGRGRPHDRLRVPLGLPRAAAAAAPRASPPTPSSASPPTTP